MADGQSRGIKKSLFNAQSTVSDSATFDFVINGTNIKITKADLVNEFGTVGTLVQEGPVADVPVLQKVGTENQIRNIGAGVGGKVSVNAENGITVGWDVSFDSVGKPLTVNPTASPVVFRSLVNGTGISITEDGNGLVITATGVTTPNIEIPINQESDFPTQDATTITLEGINQYVIGSDFTTTKNIIVEPGAFPTWTSQSIGGPAVTFAGTGAMFTMHDANLNMKNTNLAISGSGSYFDLKDTVGSVFFFLMRWTSLNGGAKIGTSDNLLVWQQENSNAILVDDGWTFTGANSGIVSASKYLLVTTSATCKFIDLGASVIGNCELVNLDCNGPTGSIAVNAAAASANIMAGNVGNLQGLAIRGNITPLAGGADPSDIRWSMTKNDQLADSLTDAFVVMNANATVTTISAVNTPVKVAGTFVVKEASRFTCDTTGKCTFDKERDEKFPFDILVRAAPSSGGAKNFTVYLARNGTVIADSGVPGLAASGSPALICVPWQRTATITDDYEIYIENNDDAQDFLVTTARLRIK